MISLGNTIKIGQQNISIPNVADVVKGWMQSINAKKVTSSIQDGDVVEVLTDVNFNGMIQVQNPYQLSLHAEGERSWDWVSVWCDYTDFKLDDIFIYKQTKYRVMNKHNWQDFGYGYYEYECVRDYNG